MRDVLARNEVDPSLVRLCRTGIDRVGAIEQSEANDEPSESLRIAFVGRCERAKGVHVLVEAVQGLSSLVAIEVFFFGSYWETNYGRDLRRRMKGDERFHEPELHDRARLRERRPRGIGGQLRAAFGHSAHLWMWDFASMSSELENAGFVRIRRAEFGDSGDAAFEAVEERARWTDCPGVERFRAA